METGRRRRREKVVLKKDGKSTLNIFLHETNPKPPASNKKKIRFDEYTERAFSKKFASCNESEWNLLDSYTFNNNSRQNK